MSYEICKSIVLTKDKKVFLTTRSNNVSPSTYSRWECPSLSKIFEEQGEEKVLTALGDMIWEGNLQLRNGSKLVNLFDKAMRQIPRRRFNWESISRKTMSQFLANAVLKYREDPNASLADEIEELKALQNSREYILKVAKEDQMNIMDYADDESIKTDKNLLLEVIRLCGKSVMFHLPNNFKDNKEIAMAVLKENGYHYNQFGANLKKDREIILEAFRDRNDSNHAFRITEILEDALMIPGTNEIDAAFICQLIEICPTLHLEGTKLLQIREIALKFCQKCTHFMYDISTYLPKEFAEEKEFQDILLERCKEIAEQKEKSVDEIVSKLQKSLTKRGIEFPIEYPVFNWYMTEESYEDYIINKPDKDGNYDTGEYCGTIRAGDLCFDIMDWSDHLRFELYVGGVDSGYGYSDKLEHKGYPYDFCDEFDVQYNGTDSFPIFKQKAENMLIQELRRVNAKVYSEQEVDLMDKANEVIRLW